jgi:hypothetical protein
LIEFFEGMILFLSKVVSNQSNQEVPFSDKGKRNSSTTPKGRDFW